MTVKELMESKYKDIAKRGDKVNKSYCTELTHDILVDYGFIQPHWTGDGWRIFRFWYGSGIHTKKHIKEIKITEARCKHKYTGDKVYLKISFSYHKKQYSIPLSRFIYAWFTKEGVPAGMDVEHISNNQYDNRLCNLRLCTREENLAKRFTDNPNN